MNTEIQVRTAIVYDAPHIYDLIEQHASNGNLLPRPLSDIYRNIRNFYVVQVNEEVVGCGALEIFTEILGEVRSLVVSERHKGMGIGKLITQQIIAEAQRLKLKQVMALTYVPDFFLRLGFETVSRQILPEKIWGVCVKCYKFNHCDEIAVLLKLNQTNLPTGIGD